MMSIQAKIQKLREQGNSSFQKKNFSAAIDFYKRGLQLDEENPHLNSNLAQAYLERNEFRLAEYYAEVAINNNKNSAKGYFRAAKACAGQGHKSKAVKFLRDGIRNCADTYDLKNYLQTLYEEDQDSIRVSSERPPNESTMDVPALISDSDSDDDLYNVKRSRSTSTSRVVTNTTTTTTLESQKSPSVNQRSVSMSRNTNSNVGNKASKKSNKRKKNKNDDHPFLFTLETIKKEKGIENITPEQFWINKRKELQTLMKEGSEVMGSGLSRKAVEKYKIAFDMILDHSIQVFKMDEIDFIVLKYALCIGWIELANYGDIAKAVEYLREIEENRASKFPAVFYGLGSAYYKLNRYKAATEHLEKGLLFLQREVKFDVQPWPGTNNIIQETTRSGLDELLKELLKTCRAYHEPDAICRYSKCLTLSSHIIPSEHIFYSDPDFCGFVIVICEEKCRIEYHMACWKDYKETTTNNTIGKLSDKDFIGKECPTTDCLNQDNKRSVIIKIEIVGDDTTVKTCIEAPKNDTVIKESKKTKKKKNEKIAETVLQDKPKVKARPKVKKITVQTTSQDIPTTNSVEELSSRLQKLKVLRDINFGYTDENRWNPQEKFYGRADIENLGTFLSSKNIDETEAIRAKKEFIFSYFYEFIRDEGPKPITDLERKWQNEAGDFEGVKEFMSTHSNICSFLLQSYRFASIDDYICLAEQLPETYKKAKSELLECLSFMFKGRVECAKPLTDESQSNIETKIKNDYVIYDVYGTSSAPVPETECNLISANSETLRGSNTSLAVSATEEYDANDLTTDFNNLIVEDPDIDVIDFSTLATNRMPSLKEEGVVRERVKIDSVSTTNDGEYSEYDNGDNEEYISDLDSEDDSSEMEDEEENDKNEESSGDEEEQGIKMESVEHKNEHDVNEDEDESKDQEEALKEDNSMKCLGRTLKNEDEVNDKNTDEGKEQEGNLKENNSVKCLDRTLKNNEVNDNNTIENNEQEENLSKNNLVKCLDDNLRPDASEFKPSAEKSSDLVHIHHPNLSAETDKVSKPIDISPLEDRLYNENSGNPSPKKWSLEDGLSYTDSNEWSLEDGQSPTNPNQWSLEDGQVHINHNKWSLEDGQLERNGMQRLDIFPPSMKAATFITPPVQQIITSNVSIQTDDTKHLEEELINLESIVKKLEEELESEKDKQETSKRTSDSKIEQQDKKIKELELKISKIVEENNKSIKNLEDELKNKEQEFEAEKNKFEKEKKERQVSESTTKEMMRNLISETGQKVKELEETKKELSQYQQLILKTKKEGGELKFNFHKNKCMDTLQAMRSKVKYLTDTTVPKKSEVIAAIKDWEQYLNITTEQEIQFRVHYASLSEKAGSIPFSDIDNLSFPEIPKEPDCPLDTIEEMVHRVFDESNEMKNKLKEQYQVMTKLLGEQQQTLQHTSELKKAIDNRSEKLLKTLDGNGHEPETSKPLDKQNEGAIKLVATKEKEQKSEESSNAEEKVLEVNVGLNSQSKNMNNIFASVMPMNPSVGIPLYQHAAPAYQPNMYQLGPPSYVYPPSTAYPLPLPVQYGQHQGHPVIIPSHRPQAAPAFVGSDKLQSSMQATELNTQSSGAIVKEFKSAPTSSSPSEVSKPSTSTVNSQVLKAERTGKLLENETTNKAVLEKKKSASPAFGLTPIEPTKPVSAPIATPSTLASSQAKALPNYTTVTAPKQKTLEIPMNAKTSKLLVPHIFNASTASGVELKTTVPTIATSSTVGIASAAVTSASASAPKTKTGGSYQKLMVQLRKHFPSKAEEELASAVAVVREKNNNSLSGLTQSTIIGSVDRVLKEKSSKKQGSMGLDKFGGNAWGGLRDSASNWTKPKESSEDDCIICMEPMDRNQTSLHCKHTFHTECITRWLRKGGVCPLCRTVDEFPPLA
ncbi:E3 ubiquitin-protein ligase TTC3-like isoform X2 [Periplaneta americana]|uniref:E3 ubiquitin-protein ligase TTC3-like isoform X2 n=1 Tax=Periplaneta americana TaxID=6978 RepID=UPI0037E8377F